MKKASWAKWPARYVSQTNQENEKIISANQEEAWTLCTNQTTVWNINLIIGDILIIIVFDPWTKVVSLVDFSLFFGFKSYFRNVFLCLVMSLVRREEYYKSSLIKTRNLSLTPRSSNLKPILQNLVSPAPPPYPRGSRLKPSPPYTTPNPSLLIFSSIHQNNSSLFILTLQSSSSSNLFILTLRSSS